MRKSLGTLALSMALLGSLACSAQSVRDAMRGAGEADAAAVDGGASPSDGAVPSLTSPQLRVHLVDGPLDKYQEVQVDVQKVAIVAQSGAQIELSAPNAIHDLLRLQGGISAMLADRELPPDRYTQIRLLLGARNTLRLTGASGSALPLRVPSGQQSGLKINIDLDLQNGGGRDLYVDFDVAESLHVTKAGKNERYVLRPVLRAAVKQASGRVVGRLTRGDSGEGLAGVPVLAEALDENGQPRIVRRVMTGADGTYSLDLLPFGHYVVVAQPVQPGLVFTPQASPRLQLSPTLVQARFDASFALADEAGTVDLQISPAAQDADADLCIALTEVADATVIVAAGTPTLADGIEQLLLGPLPTGSYSVQCQRRTTQDGAEPMVKTTDRVPLTISDSGIATASLTF